MMLFLLAAAGGQECGAQRLEEAEVRLPYRELREILKAARENSGENKLPDRPPALQGASLKVSGGDRGLKAEARFRIAGFGAPGSLRLLSGPLAVEGVEPESAVITADESGLSLVSDGSGAESATLRLLPTAADGSFSLELPPCPSAVLEVGALAGGGALRCEFPGGESTLVAGGRQPLPAGGAKIRITFLNEDSARAALSPPEESEWSWQHQALVTPQEDDLDYQIVSRASAAQGSGLSAELPLPAEAREVRATGADLAGQRIARGADGRRLLRLEWETRDTLDRRIVLCYRIPRQPLDRSWRLQAPGVEGTRARFVLAEDPLWLFSADGLSAPSAAAGLPAELAERLGATSCFLLEAGPTVELKVSRAPLAATAEGAVRRACWEHHVEPDGAVMATGKLEISHTGAFALTLDTPAGLQLLSCAMDGKPVAPLDMGEGRLKLPLPPAADKTVEVAIAFTGKLPAPLDPVSGTLGLELPLSAAFIHSLEWTLNLPPGYQAETHGNLRRSAAESPAPPERIRLTRGLCRDERPEVRVFYQRAGLGAAAR